jgi:uncharacterized protein YndB with AHSA1/START domain
MTTFRTSRELPAPPEVVFAAFKDPARLARWWGPAGFTNSFRTFEFRPGGRWEFTMHGPDGTDYPNQAVFLEIVPEALVRIRHVSQPHFELSISLGPGAKGTLVSWVQAFDHPEVAASIRHIVEPANEQNLDRLAAEVETGAK